MDNMFIKANKERREKIIQENINIADEVLESGKLNSNYLLKKTSKKVRRTISLDETVDDFYNELCEIVGMTRSNLIENVLRVAILENKEIKELSKKDNEVKKLINMYLNKI